MTELDNNVFIKSWHFKEDPLDKRYLICYIDNSCFQINLPKEVPVEYLQKHLLLNIDRDLREKGWVKDELRDRLTNYIYDDNKIQPVLRHSVDSEPKYNPADDPYYKQESLYIDKEIN